MNAGRVCGLLAALSLLVGCPPAPSEPPPPPRKAELVPAPPRALGAYAAGTDSAPRPELRGPSGEPEIEPEPAPPDPAPEANPEGSAAPGPDAAPTPEGTAL